MSRPGGDSPSHSANWPPQSECDAAETPRSACVAIGQCNRPPFRLRIVALAEVRPEPIVSREPHVLGRGHHNVGNHPRLQAAHPIGEHRLGNPAENLEALGQQRQGCPGLLVSGEPHEPEPRPRQYCAEHVQPALDTPVDDQRVARCPHRRSAAAMIALPAASPWPPGAGSSAPTPSSRRHARPATVASPRSVPVSWSPARRPTARRRHSCGHGPSAARRHHQPHAVRRSASPFCGSCRRSPRHPDSCPHPGRRPIRPSVPSRSSIEAPVR